MGDRADHGLLGLGGRAALWGLFLFLQLQRNLVTRYVEFLIELLGTQAAHVVMRRLQGLIGDDEEGGAEARFDGVDLVALFVEQVGRGRDRQMHVQRRGVFLHRLFLDIAQDMQRRGLHAADMAGALAARAHQAARFAERRAQALARHLQQTEARDAPDLHARAVGLERLDQAILHLALIARRGHVDEVDDDQAAQIAQLELARELIGGFEIGIERGLFDVGALGGARRVDVDGDQRLGMVEYQCAAGFQAHVARKRGFDLVFDLKAREQRRLVLVKLELAQILRHDLRHELLSALVDLGVVDQDFADIGPQVIADRADHQVAFLVDQERRRALGGGLADGVPQVHQVIEVPLQLFDALADASGADNDRVVLGNIELGHRLAHLGALFSLDAARDAAALGVVRHQHQVAPGQTHEAGQRRALAATFFLFDLNDQLLAFLDDVADTHLPDGGAVVVAGEIDARDFLERQEALAFGAVVDEGGFQAGFDAGDFALVDVPFLLLIGGGFDIEVEEFLAVDNRHAQLFRMSCVKQHSLHCSYPDAAQCASPAVDRLRVLFRWPTDARAICGRRLADAAIPAGSVVNPYIPPTRVRNAKPCLIRPGP